MNVHSVVTQTIEPASIEELAEGVRAHNHSAIYPLGCGSWQDLGYPPTKPGVAISTKKLNRVVDYPHEELTITVEAGILVSELQRILAEKGQMLPIDCPHPENATLGGLLATNTSGPRRLAYGTARDSVLGLDVIDATGTRIHGGGRVVKNVAGYDLPKMHIGALGTLGIIVEATLKVRPRPEKTASVEIPIDPANVSAALAKLRASKLRPVSVEIETLMTASSNSENLGMEMVFEDCAEAVDFQLELTNAVLEPFARWKNSKPMLPDRSASQSENFTIVQNSCDRLCEQVQSERPGGFIARFCVKPTKSADIIMDLWETYDLMKLKAHALSGVVWAHWKQIGFEIGFEGEVVESMRLLASDAGGRLTIPKCPDHCKHRLPIWGDIGPEIEWMRRLRTALDPNRVINPGRFVVE